MNKIGLRTLEDLPKGRFIDVYRGEIITSQEADRREDSRAGKDSYLYTMDKFAEDMNIPADKLYVVDGEFYGSITRFINHSCDPNCRQFTVSYNHADAYVYDLALFTVRPIQAGTELTFNYLDKEDDGLGASTTTNGKVGGGGAADGEGGPGGGVDGEERKDDKEPTKCLCRADNCRGYLWI